MISEFPLFVFSTCSGLAAGTYAVSAFFAKDRVDAKRSWLLPLVCIVLLGTGLLGTLAHLGHPERFLNAFVNPSAMIAQEAYWSIAFGVLLLVDLILGFKGRTVPAAVRWLGVVAAVGLAVVTGWAYFTCHGVVAWSQLATLPLFVVGDAAMGAALVGTLWLGACKRKSFRTMVVVLEVLLAATLIAETLAFDQAGQGIAPFVVALVIAPVVTLGIVLFGKKAIPAPARAWLIFGCTFVGVTIARYAFYAASVL